MEDFRCPHCNKKIELSEVAKKRASKEIKAAKDQAKIEADRFAAQEIQAAKNETKAAKNEAQIKAKKIIDQERKKRNVEVSEAKKAGRAIALNESQKQLDKERAERDKERNLHKLREERLLKDFEKLKKRQSQGLTADQGTGQEQQMADFLKEVMEDHGYNDEIITIKKGEAGGDVLQKIKHEGVEIGRILYESKETGSFSNKWIEKLQKDLKEAKAGVGIIFTVALPKGFDKKKGFSGEKNIFICKYVFDTLRYLALTRRFLMVAWYENNQGRKKDNRISAEEFFNLPNTQSIFNLVDTHFVSLGEDLEKSINSLAKVKNKYSEIIKYLDELYTLIGQFGLKRKK